MKILGEDGHLEPRRETQEEASPAGTLSWDFRPGAGENKCLLFKFPLGLGCFVMAAQQTNAVPKQLLQKRKGNLPSIPYSAHSPRCHLFQGCPPSLLTNENSETQRHRRG